MVKHLTDHQSMLRPVVRLAMPVLMEKLLIMMVGFVDLWLAGVYLQEKHLAASGLIAYLLWLIPCLFGPVAIGALALTARFVGARDGAGAIRVTNQSLLLGAGLATVVTVTGVLFGADLVRLCGLPTAASKLAEEYVRILVPAIPLIMLQQVGIACLRGAGDMMIVFVSMALVNVVNTVVGVVLVTGAGGMPQLGWRGLAIGTVSGYVVGGCVVLAVLWRGRAGLKIQWHSLRPDLTLMRRVLRIGIPGGIDSIAIVGCHLAFLSVINALGTAAAAAHGVSLRIESLAYLPGTAFQVAAATMAGQFLGAADPQRATRSVLVALLVGGGMMVLAGLWFFVQAEPLTLFFLGEQTRETSVTASQLLRIVAFAMPFLALTMILTGALRGAGDTAWPLLFTLIGFLCVRIPLANWLAWDSLTLPGFGVVGGWGLGVVGAWYAMTIDLGLRALLVTLRFRHGGWRKVEV